MEQWLYALNNYCSFLVYEKQHKFYGNDVLKVSGICHVEFYFKSITYWIFSWICN